MPIHGTGIRALHPAPGKMLRTLILGGYYDAKAGHVAVANPDLKFATAFWSAIEKELLGWATGESSFAVVNLLEAAEEGFEEEQKEVVRSALRKGRKSLVKAESGGNKGAGRLLSLI